ncbi:DUF1592 domain-containing protein [Planctomicrobium sp.]|nr:DUF1592 domain-containing protein [Planctomicrobium sp.]
MELTSHRPVLIMTLICMVWGPSSMVFAADSSVDFQKNVQPLLETYCYECHSGDEPNGDLDLTKFASVADVTRDFQSWESVIEQLQHGSMPPADERQPSERERQSAIQWHQDFINSIEVRPAQFKPRRLSVIEYRNSLQSVFGFSLDVAIIEAEQTVTERSLVVKLLPTDPPGKSGFKNDTHANPLSTVVWDQYNFLIDAAVEQLFSSSRRIELEAMIGPFNLDQFSTAQAKSLLNELVERAWRRPVPNEQMDKIHSRIQGRQGQALVDVVKLEIKTALMSPQFIYRGLLLTGTPGERQPVDEYELAERLSYFVWGDIPDEHLRTLAAAGTLSDQKNLSAELQRLLASPKAHYLTEVFATEWLSLSEIEHITDDVPRMVALQTQSADFMNYLFTEDRPLIEFIDSEVAFINPHTSNMYGRDARQMSKYSRRKGIEREIVSNQKISLVDTKERGGILTMPGILAMNKGPILRGTWMLESILGEELPDPPANVGQVPPNRGGENLSFRQRFGEHRKNPTCGICHNKIDPLGFALQRFDNQGKYIKQTNSSDDTIDTSGQLPSGEIFNNFEELKLILTTSQREAVIRNIVERTMAFALCRQLTIIDRPAVEEITNELKQSNGTWQDLFLAVVNSVPFRETILPELN